MSKSFTKLFASITESTIWLEPDQTRLLWLTMLAMADRRGRVEGSLPGLAHRARISVEACEIGLNTFLLPDAYSRTKDHEGRRIKEIDGGWQLLNYDKYRSMRDEESILESKRNYINAKRAKERNEKPKDVENVDLSRSMYTQAEAEAEAEAEVNTKELKKKGPAALKKSPATPCGVNRPDDVCEEAWEDWTAHRRKAKASITARVIDKLRESARHAGMSLEQAMDWTVGQNHQGFYPPKGGQHAPAQRPAPGSYAERRENQLIGAAILTGTYRPQDPQCPPPYVMTLEHDDAKIAR